MEAYGLSTVFYEAYIREKTMYGIYVIRGIYDLADPEKGKKTLYRISAAKNAAIVLEEFVKLVSKLR